MTPIHEIAFLVLVGALTCLMQTGSDGPKTATFKVPAYEQPNLQKKPRQFIDPTTFKSYLHTEVGYEEDGLAVFKIEKADWYQVMTHSGQALWLHLPNVETPRSSPQSPSKKTADSPAWRLEEIEDLVGQGGGRVGPDHQRSLRKEDLKTPLSLPKESVAAI